MGQVTDWNGKAEEVSGFSREEAFGKEFLSFVDAECREQVPEDQLEPPWATECNAAPASRAYRSVTVKRWLLS